MISIEFHKVFSYTNSVVVAPADKAYAFKDRLIEMERLLEEAKPHLPGEMQRRVKAVVGEITLVEYPKRPIRPQLLEDMAS